MRLVEDHMNKHGRIAIVASSFNPVITDALVEGAKTTMVARGFSEDQIEVLRVPGAFEIPLACQWAIEARAIGVIALGCVIRGGTPHFEFVADQVASGVNRVSLDAGVPIAFGVLTTDNLEQAKVRATGTTVPAQHHPGAGSEEAPTHGNKGSEAAVALVEMLSLKKRIMDGLNGQ
jgi:6,7-dimethyl-8-ribityllumazine synthase